jgi:hypothetical protein
MRFQKARGAWADHPVAEAIGGGPAPKKPEQPPAKWNGSKSLF